jgi:hypothetical protein
MSRTIRRSCGSVLLESWIFSCLRVPQEGLAAELSLQLTDDGADLAVLTDRHGIGKERWTRGWWVPSVSAGWPSR